MELMKYAYRRLLPDPSVSYDLVALTRCCKRLGFRGLIPYVPDTYGIRLKVF